MGRLTLAERAPRGRLLLLLPLLVACSEVAPAPHAPRTLEAAIRVLGRGAGPEPSASHAVVVDEIGKRVTIVHSTHVSVFALDGMHLGAVGRRGDGPGEFRATLPVGVAPGEVMVYDRRRHRVTRIRTDLLTAESSFAAPRGLRGGTNAFDVAGVRWVTPTGHLVVEGIVLSDPGTRVRTTPGYALLAPTDSLVRVVGKANGETDCRGAIRLPFCQRALLAMREDGHEVIHLEPGLAADSTRAFALVRSGLDGDTPARARIQLPRRFIPRRVDDSIRRVLVAQGVPPDRLEATPSPPVAAIVSWLVVGRDGTAWLAGFADGRLRPWWVISSEGTLVGVVHLDADLVLGGVSAQGAWAARDRDDGDVELLRITVDPTFDAEQVGR